MKIIITHPVVTDGVRLNAGQVVDAPPELAMEWIGADCAIAVRDEPAPKRARPAQPRKESDQ